MKKILFTFSILLIVQINSTVALAQHEHEMKNKSTKNLLFSTNNSEFKAEVWVASEKIPINKNLLIYLKLSSGLIIDTSNVTITINSNDNKEMNSSIIMNYSSGLYNSAVIFKEPADYRFMFSFNVIDSIGYVHNTGFSFTKDIKNNNNEDNSNNGFMGMGSEMWIIMGGIMAAMMIVVMITAAHK